MQSDKQEAKWRDQFKKIGREAVRDKLHAGVYWRTRQGAVAERWLREQEAAEDSANKWVRAATIAGVGVKLCACVEVMHLAESKFLRHAAFKALVEKKSYTGPVSVFGRDYQGNYAPLIDVCQTFDQLRCEVSAGPLEATWMRRTDRDFCS